MKFMSSIVLGALAFAQVATAQINRRYEAADLHGVWKLTRFVTTETGARAKDWCPGVFGTLSYLPMGFMTVSINCHHVEAGTQAEAMRGSLFYSGPFEVDSAKGDVIHRARNFSHPSLHVVQRRKLTMKDRNHLRLSGDLKGGGQVTLDWVRQEQFQPSDDKLTGLYELVGSENEVDGRTDVPFCNGFFGSILYTPGGHAAVSINCGKKLDPHVVEPADQFGRKYFYSGHYEVRGDSILLTPDNASEASQIGSPVVRAMKIKGDLLTLEGVNGSKFKAIWKKLGSFAPTSVVACKGKQSGAKYQIAITAASAEKSAPLTATLRSTDGAELGVYAVKRSLTPQTGNITFKGKGFSLQVLRAMAPTARGITSELNALLADGSRLKLDSDQLTCVLGN